MKKNSAQAGQVLLIMLLVLVVGLTIGLSVATRSVSDIKISSQLEESSRAFAAAEAGIEAALKGETVSTSPVSIGNAAYTFTSTPATGTEPVKIGIADTYTVWLVGHKADGSLDYATTYSGSSINVCWGDAGVSPKPAMEIGVVHKEASGQYNIWRGAFDPDPANRVSPNNFASVDSGSCGGLVHKKNINLAALSGTKIALRLRPFYAGTNVAVSPADGATLPSQGLNIMATGKAGETTRKISVIQPYPSLPGIFDYVLFSGTEVSK